MLARDTVPAFAQLAAQCEAYFGFLSDQAREVLDPGHKAAYYRAARVLRDYAPRWDHLVPESVLLDAPAARAAARAAAASAVVPLAQLLEHSRAIERKLEEVSDAPAQRLMRAFLADLSELVAAIGTK